MMPGFYPCKMRLARPGTGWKSPVMQDIIEETPGSGVTGTPMRQRPDLGSAQKCLTSDSSRTIQCVEYEKLNPEDLSQLITIRVTMIRMS
ncbi:hypothetical protein Celaphus_00018618, partial [Cervus elaphus hippelaphus]